MNFLALLVSVTQEVTPATGPGRGRSTEGRGLQAPPAGTRAAATRFARSRAAPLSLAEQNRLNRLGQGGRSGANSWMERLNPRGLTAYRQFRESLANAGTLPPGEAARRTDRFVLWVARQRELTDNPGFRRERDLRR